MEIYCTVEQNTSVYQKCEQPKVDFYSIEPENVKKILQKKNLLSSKVIG